MSRETCESFRSDVAAGRPSLPLTLHLLNCADCRAYRRSIARMNHIVRKTPHPIPPSLMNLPDSSPLTPQGAERRSLMIRTLLGGTAIATATALGLFVGPRLNPAASFAADVKAAIAQANTWHFSGWRLVEGKQVRWEIWGRRAPFFYREQFGDNLLITDDKEQLRLVPPGDHRPKGLALTMASDPNRKAAALVQTPESFIAGIGGDFIGSLKPVGRQKYAAFLQSPVRKTVGLKQMDEQGTLTVDMRTKLPIYYQLKRAVHQGNRNENMPPDPSAPLESTWTQAELTAEYNVPIPENVTKASAPDTFAKVNLLRPASGPSVPTTGTGSGNGITVHANVISQDSDGNLHIRFEGWFGQQKHYNGLPIQLFVQDQGIVRISGKGTEKMVPGLQDDQGNIYVPLSNPVGQINSVNPEWYLTPLEPLQPGQPRPKNLKAETYVSATWYEYLPEVRTGTAHDLASAGFTLTIPLPETVAPTDFETRPVPHGIQLGDGRSTLALATALARVQAYRAGLVGNDKQERLAYWTQVALKEAERAPISKRYRSMLQRELTTKPGQP